MAKAADEPRSGRGSLTEPVLGCRCDCGGERVRCPHGFHRHFRNRPLRDRERLAEVVAALRDAELDDARWPQTASRVDTAFGLHGNHLSVIEGDGPGRAELLFGRL